MSVTIEAPYPAIATRTTLPNPRLGNEEQLATQRDLRIMMNKSAWTYIKTSSLKIYRYNFSVTLEKAEEIEQFLLSYIGEKWKLTDHHGVERIGYCLTNPNVLSLQRAHSGAEVCTAYGYTLNERVDWELEFEA